MVRRFRGWPTMVGAVLALLVTAAPERAHAWECLAGGCPVWCELPIAYQIGRLPEGVDEAAFIAEIQRAVGDWEAVECSELAFSYEGRIPEGGATAPLTVEFLDPWDTSMGSASTTITVSTPRWSMEGCIPDAGMFFNAQGFVFAIGGTGGAVDLYTSVAGALGRAFGLGNSSDPNSVMRSTESGGPGEITADDVEGVCTLYGSGEGLSLCSRCLRDELCGGEADRCVEYPDGNGYCGTACTEGGGECATDESCVPVGDAMQCVRVLEGEQQCAVGGSGQSCDPCSSSDECAGECLAFSDGASYCLNPCGASGECADGEDCVMTVSQMFCVPLVDGEPSCSGDPSVPDAGPPPMDAGFDGGDGGDGGGCGCVVAAPHRSAPTAWLLLGAAALFARRRR